MEESVKLKNNNPTQFYKERSEEVRLEINRLTKKARMWVVIRLFAFLAIVSGVYFTYSYGGWSVVTGIGLLVVFLIFVRKSAENKEALFLAKSLLKINLDELQLLEEYRLDQFDAGEEFKDPKHAFSYDMDVFVQNGCFQYLNRTITKEGKKVMAAHLLEGVEDIKATQEAIEELSTQMKWTQEYRAKGIVSKENEKGLSTTNGWGEEVVPTTVAMRILSFLLPIVGILGTLAYNLDVISGFLFSLLFVGVMLPTLLKVKQTNEISKQISAIGDRIKAMQEQLVSLEKNTFESQKLAAYYNTLFQHQQNGSKALAALAKILKQIEYRNNVLVAILLNFYLAWDYRMTLKIAKWKEDYGVYLADWEEILVEFEFLIAGANLRFNRLDATCYPVVNSTDEKIELEELGHPLIPAEKLVANDFKMSENQQFSIVTGPNMAGKSTFLRSVGVNLMLAKAGFPVLAKSFVFPNLKLYSSMRTSDDLSNESSYFHAELIRLRFIVDAIERGENVFIILDEILKGTNSKDKEEGSAKFLEKLVSLNAKGIIATHDLKLTELADQNSTLFNNYFDTTIEGEDITFDYKIRDGVAQNMNASFLLKKMGLINV